MITLKHSTGAAIPVSTRHNHHEHAKINRSPSNLVRSDVSEERHTPSIFENKTLLAGAAIRATIDLEGIGTSTKIDRRQLDLSVLSKISCKNHRLMNYETTKPISGLNITGATCRRKKSPWSPSRSPPSPDALGSFESANNFDPAQISSLIERQVRLISN